ncbi:MAG: sigma 54-interacting transcriptional regulator [Pseudomonadota bacterium]
MARGSVLVADDDSAIRIVLNQALTRAGFEVRMTSNVSSLWQWISEGEGDCVVSDVIMPDGDAFELLPRIKSIRPELPVILISAQNTFMTALKAQEAQAYEYLPKPFDLALLTSAVERAIFEPKDNRSTQTVEAYGEEMPLVGRSSQMQEIYRSIARLRQSDYSVMFSGETGTGKNLMARVLHDFGRRKHNPFVPVNLAAVPVEAIESEIFGKVHNDGNVSAGALRSADGGTLYLDEISLLPETAQVRLLRVLMQGQAIPIDGTDPVRIDVRIVSSTSRDMDQMIRQGTFREDLFYRLSMVPIHVPSLRNRTEDIPDLARHFVRISEAEGAQARHIDPAAIKLLKEQVWHGNVRELENLIRRVCILYPQETITAGYVKSEIKNSGYFRQGMEKASNGGFAGLRGATEYFVNRYFDEHSEAGPPDGVYQRFLEEFEYPLITSALASTNGNQIKAAKILGLNRNTLRKKIQELGIRIVKTAK